MPLPNDFADQNCSIARTLEVIGERWSLLIIRDAFLGIRRFDDIQADLGISRNVLSARLAKLVDQGILRREQYSERPPRHEYRLTQRGRDLWPVLMAAMEFGDRHAPTEGGVPRIIVHRACGHEIDKTHLRCDHCGTDVTTRDVRMVEGPGAASPIGELLPAETA